jgi:hypothetical protein
MILKIMKNSLKSYLKSLKLVRILLVSILSILVILFLLKIVFPLLGQLTFSKTGFQVNSYYSLVAITLVCLIPYLIGMLFVNELSDERDFQSSHLLVLPSARKNFLLVRMFFAAFVCFVLLLLTILLIKPVPTEGWLRNLFAACLLSIQAPFVCLLICTLLTKKVKRISILILCSLFLITVPFGLLVHHPWNYFVFFSPLYWVSWAWIILSPVESLIYGSIAVFLTFGAIVLLFRNYNKTITRV